jgi:hypothetical protein
MPSAAGSVGTDADVEGAAADHLTGDEGAVDQNDQTEQEVEGDDDYWDEEDELANDFQRERAGSEGGIDTPSPSGEQHAWHERQRVSACCPSPIKLFGHWHSASPPAIRVMRHTECHDPQHSALNEFAQGRSAQTTARRGLRTVLPAALHTSMHRHSACSEVSPMLIVDTHSGCRKGTHGWCQKFEMSRQNGVVEGERDKRDSKIGSAACRQRCP